MLCPDASFRGGHFADWAVDFIAVGTVFAELGGAVVCSAGLPGARKGGHGGSEGFPGPDHDAIVLLLAFACRLLLPVRCVLVSRGGALALARRCLRLGHIEQGFGWQERRGR